MRRAGILLGMALSLMVCTYKELPPPDDVDILCGCNNKEGIDFLNAEAVVVQPSPDAEIIFSVTAANSGFIPCNLPDSVRNKLVHLMHVRFSGQGKNHCGTMGPSPHALFLTDVAPI